MSDNPLKEFRSGAAELDPNRAERMRQRVLNAIAADGSGPNTVGAAPMEPSFQEADVLPMLNDYPVDVDGRRRRSPAPAFAALLVVLAILATAALVIARQGSVPSGDGPRPLPDLRSIAGAASALPDKPLDESKFQYRRTTSASPTTGQTVTEEVWVAADGTGVARNAQSSGSLVRAGTTIPPVHEDRDIASTRHFGGWFYGDLRALPADAAALRATLEGTAGGGLSNAEIGRLATDLVSWTATPPAVRGAAFQVLSDVGFNYVDDIAVQGRVGQRWILADSKGTHVVIVDPVSTRPIAFYDAPPGMAPDMSNANRWVVYEAAEFTDTAG